MNLKSPATNVLFAILCLASLSLFTGCGDPGIGAVPVTGTITVDGTPMEGAMVVFNPVDGTRAASGRTDAEGKSSLPPEINGDGALPGEYKISVTKHLAAEDDLPTEVDPNDEAVEQDGARVLIAPMAQMFLFGTEIDYEVSLLESGFKFRNPNVTDACGCGESVKFKDLDELTAEQGDA